jgi:hypothetical protein
MDYDAHHFDITPALEYLSIILTVGKSGYNHVALRQLSSIIENLPRLKNSESSRIVATTKKLNSV